MTTGVDITVENLRIAALTRSDRPQRPILSGINFHVASGESLAIMGPSGAGKTTLVKAMLGDLGHGLEVTCGRIAIDDHLPLSMRGGALRAFRRECAYVDQDPGATLPPRWSVRRILRQRAGLTDDEALVLLSDFGIADIGGILDRTPTQLSGGQRRRLGIAAGVAGPPKLLLIDEPTAGVDATAAKVVLDSLKVAQRRSGATCVVITHDRKVAEELANRVIFIGDDATGQDVGEPRPFTAQAENRAGADTILSIENLTIARGCQEILTDFNLSIRRGEIVGISGPSGRGKTTLLRAILGLHPISQGTISGADPHSVGWIPQESDLSINPAVPVATILRRAAKRTAEHTAARTTKGSVDVSEISSVLHALDLPDYLDLSPRLQVQHLRRCKADQLSGGQRQRVNIARALLRNPRILVADEPTSALDKANALRVVSLLKSSASQRATIIASHDPDVLAACDRVIEL